MKMEIIATRDIVSNLYGQPMFVPTIGGAIRAFGDECKRKEPNNILSTHPEDFELWHLGSWDDNTGIFDMFPHEHRKQIAVGANYRE